MVDRDGDRRVLAAMAQHGANLTKPAHTLHYLYFPAKAAAEQAGNELRSAGFDVEVKTAAQAGLLKRLFGKKEYLCLAQKHAVPSERNVFATTDTMNALAARLGGNYDGWEASIEQ